MKKLLFAGIAVSMLAACSNDEVVPVNNESNAIKFGVTAENGTRADDIYCPTNEFGEFNVFATYGSPAAEYIANDLIKKNSTWENMTGTRYWPNTGNVTFFGYVNADGTFDKSDVAAPKFDDFAPKTDIDKQLDLMYACEVQAKGEKDNKVTLNFRHALSQIVFNARNDDANLYVEISGVSIVNIKGQGDYILPTTSTQGNLDHNYGDNVYVENTRGQWDFGSITSDAEYTVSVLNGTNAVAVNGQLDEDGNKTKGDIVNLTDWSKHDNGNSTVEGTPADKAKAMLLIPQNTTKFNVETKATGSYFLVNCKIWNVADPKSGKQDSDIVLWEGQNGQSENVMIPVEFKWEEGKKYLYTFVFGNGNGGYTGPDDPKPVLVPITFDVTIDEFFEVDGVEYETGVPAK